MRRVSNFAVTDRDYFSNFTQYIPTESEPFVSKMIITRVLRGSARLSTIKLKIKKTVLTHYIRTCNVVIKKR